MSVYRIVRVRRAGKPLTRASLIHSGITAANEAEAFARLFDSVPSYRAAHQRGELVAEAITKGAA